MMSAVAAGSNHAASGKRPGKDRSGNRSVQSSSNTHTVKHDSKQDTTPTTGKTAQPTPEQVRLAQMVADKKDTAEESDFNQKIQRLVELTGRSKDEVAVALHDSENDADRAAYLLLEEGVTLDQGEWRETGKKKKKNTQPANQKNDGTVVNHSGDNKTEKSDQQRGGDRDFNIDKSDNSSMPPRRQRRNDARPPRLSRGRGHDKGGNIGDRENDNANWNNEDNRSGGGFRDRGRGRGRGGLGRGGRGGPRERTDRRSFGTERFDNNRFDSNNQFQSSRFEGNITQFESPAPFDKGPQIDTWTNETAEMPPKEENWDLQTEDWNDDVVDTWTGGLAETTVFEAKAQPASMNHDAGVAMIADNGAAMSQQNSLPQRIDLTTLLQPKSPGPPQQDETSGPSPESQFISQYNKEATESIKNTIGIGSGNRQGPLPHGLQPQAVSNAVEQLTAALAAGGVSQSAIMSQQAVSQNTMLPQQGLSQNALMSQQAATAAAQTAAALLSQQAASQNAMLNQQTQQQQQNTLLSQQQQQLSQQQAAAAQSAMLAQQSQNAMLSQQGMARLSASQGVTMPGQSSSVQPVLHQRPKPVRSKLPPPSKIPAMAVEMPGHQMAGSLDVQFGNLEFGVDSFGFVAPETAVSNNYNTGVDANSTVVSGNLSGHLEQVNVAQVNGTIDVSAVTSAALAATSSAMISPPPGSQSAAQAPMSSLDQTPPRSAGSAGGGSAASAIYQNTTYNLGSPQQDMSVSQTMASIGQAPQQISSPELIPFPPNSQTEKKSSPLGSRSGQAPSLAQASYSNQADASALGGFTDRTASYQASAYKSSGVPSQSYGHSAAGLSQTAQYQASLNSQSIQTQNMPQALPQTVPQTAQYPSNLSSPSNQSQFASSGQNQYQSSSNSQQNHYSSGTSSSQAQFSSSPTAQSQYPSSSTQYPSNTNKYQSGQSQFQSAQSQFSATSANPYQTSSNQYQPVPNQYQASQTPYQSSTSTSPYQSSSQNQYSTNQNNYQSGQIPYQTYQAANAFQSQSGYSSQPSSNSLYQSGSNSSGAYQGGQSASSSTGYPGVHSSGTAGSFSDSQNSSDSSYHSSVRDTRSASGSYHSSPSVNQSASSYQRDSQSQSQPGSYASLQNSQITSNKLGDSLSKLTVKDTVSPDTTSQQQQQQQQQHQQQQQAGSHSVHSYEQSSPTTYTPVSTTSPSSLPTSASSTSSSLTNVTSSNMATSVISSTASSMSGSSSTTTKSSSSIPSSKGQSSFPPGVNVPLVNPQYIMSQGGMAPFFSLPQPALNVYAQGYDAELQLLQQRVALSNYYDLANTPTIPTLSGRADQTVALGSVPYADGKVSRVEVQSPVPTSQTQQQSQSTHQQAFINPAPAIPPGYSYYTYPSMLHSASFQYPPNFFMPPVTNTAAAAHAGSSIAAAGGTQYQKAYGSHTYGTNKGYDDLTAQVHDYSKAAYGAAAAAAAAAGVQPQPKGGVSAASLSSASTAAELSAAGYGGKSHPQAYDKQGFHGATATTYNQLLGNQAAAQMGATTPYHPFVPIMPHQQHSQMLHHQLQDPTSGSSRLNHQSASQAKAAVAQKNYSAAYWGGN